MTQILPTGNYVRMQEDACRRVVWNQFHATGGVSHVTE